MSNGTEYARRFGSLFMAGLFLITTVGFTALIFWQTNNSKSEQEQLESAVEASTTNQTEGENMLQGTMLANFTPITTPVTDIQVIDVVPGTGEEVKSGATVTAHYTGAYASTGEIFQSSHDSGSPIPFSLDEVIPGWTEGVPGMKVGGTRRLVIPGSKAYGEAPEGYVPGSTDRPMGPLVFDIELVSVEQ
jgi:FKBP-type peptidyl-prolyl cis-trans isomerase